MKKISHEKFPLVKIMWYDADFGSDWITMDRIKEWDEKNAVGHVAGWLIKKDKRWLTIAMVHCEDDKYMGILRIFRKSIGKIVYC